MEDRRAVLATALRVMGVGLVAPLVEAAAPFVRLPREQGNISDERERLAREVSAMTFYLHLKPAREIQSTLLALWANLDQFRRTSLVDVSELKARTAILASVNSVTLLDRANGLRWNRQALVHARLAGDSELVSLAQSKVANSGLYWGVSSEQLLADATLAIKHARSPEREGMGHAMFARVSASVGLADVALRAGDKAVELAAAPGTTPLTDRWVKPQAHMTVARGLATFPQLRAAVEAHVDEALRLLPKSATLWRMQSLVNLADARVRAGELDGGADAIQSAVGSLPPEQAEPSLMAHVREVADLAQREHPGTRSMRPIRNWLLS